MTFDLTQEEQSVFSDIQIIVLIRKAQRSQLPADFERIATNIISKNTNQFVQMEPFW